MVMFMDLDKLQAVFRLVQGFWARWHRMAITDAFKRLPAHETTRALFSA
jgi:hypothetical protein